MCLCWLALTFYGSVWVGVHLIAHIISASLPIIRPKKVVLFPEIGCVKIILSLIRPHMSNVYDNIFILFQKNTQTKNFPVASLFVQIYVFSF